MAYGTDKIDVMQKAETVDRNPAGRKARRSSGAGPTNIRNGGQPNGRQDAWTDDSAHAARHRR